MTLIQRTYDELMYYIQNKLSEMDIPIGDKLFLIGALTALERIHEERVCEDCPYRKMVADTINELKSAVQSGKFEYGRKDDQSDSGE